MTSCLNLIHRLKFLMLNNVAKLKMEIDKVE